MTLSKKYKIAMELTESARVSENQFARKLMKEDEQLDLPYSDPEGLKPINKNEKPKGFMVSFETVTDESAEEGDAADRGFLEDELQEIDAFDDDEGGVVRSAIRFIEQYPVPGDGGIESIQPSMSSMSIHDDPDRVWFTAYGSRDMYDGSVTNVSFHPEGFTIQEIMEIFKHFGGRVVVLK